VIDMVHESIAGLRLSMGREIAVSDWLFVTQGQIDRFAEAIHDRNWIHVDPVRAARESPFETTIAHGFLTLSLVTALLQSALAIADAALAINCGLNRVRFVAPVPVNSRIRGRFTAIAVDDIGAGVQVTWGVQVEREGGEKPCCVAEWLVRYAPTAAPRPA
jgi:acyl dehydratase